MYCTTSSRLHGFTIEGNEKFFSIHNMANTPLKPDLLSNHITLGCKNESGLIGTVSITYAKKECKTSKRATLIGPFFRIFG